MTDSRRSAVGHVDLVCIVHPLIATERGIRATPSPPRSLSACDRTARCLTC